MQAKITITYDNGKVHVDAPLDKLAICMEMLGYALVGISQKVVQAPLLRPRGEVETKNSGS